MMTTLATIFGILGVLGISFGVEKLPIKISPLTWFKNFLLDDTKKSISEIKIELVNCKETIVENDKKAERNEINRIKQEILSFRIMAKTPNVKIECLDFDHIFQLYDEYKSMGGNSMVDIAIEEIKMIYKEKFK